MKKANRIAVAGATGMVGKAFQGLLEKDFFPDAEIDFWQARNLRVSRLLFEDKAI